MELFVNIRKELPGFTLNVNFEAGLDALGLLGASGSGKSMTLRCIAGLEKPDKGKIVLDGRVLFDSEKGINIPCQKRRIGFLFQNYALFPNMTVEENIGFGLGSLDKIKRDSIIRKKVEMMRLDGLERRYPYQLSGGQQQRVALSRALAIEPEALLLDEPFSALDNHLRILMVKQLTETLASYHGVTLFVTHNMEEAYSVCKRLVILADGKVETQGEKDEIFMKPQTITTAQLTGCKNISAARYLSPDKLEAVEWDIKLNVNGWFDKEVEYLGIRAHSIKLATQHDNKNVFECWPSYTTETPFRMTVYLSISKRPSRQGDYNLQWEMSKEKWAELKEQPVPWKICLDPEKIIMMSR